MGLEANCTAHHAGKKSSGKARLEEKHLLFRGDFNLKIVLADIKLAEARRGALTVKFPGGPAVFNLGAEAEKWALRIRYPRSRMDKLGVKPDSQVAVLRVGDATFRKELEARAGNIADGKPRKDSDFIFFGVEDQSALKQLRVLQTFLKPTGAIWVVWPKGRPHIKEDHVRTAAVAVGLVDVKVMSFSEALSALKLMIPRSRR